MKLSLKVNSLFFCIILFLFALPLINNIERNFRSVNCESDNYKLLKPSIPSGKIHIKNNWSDAEIVGICTGSGLDTDPYVIQNYVIDGGGSGSCILIENSSDYYRIENCTISNCGSEFYDAAIKIVSANNGNITKNEVSTPDGFGIVLYDSNNTIVSDNEFIGEKGITVRFCHNNLIYLNDFINQLIGVEIRNSTEIRWDSLEQIEYVYFSNTFTRYLGNYWNGLNQFDDNNDGIGDSPHAIDKHLPSSQWVYIDYYPLFTKVENYKFDVAVQPPDMFVLSSDAGDPDIDGNFTLTWNVADRASNYSVFRYFNFITAINGSLTGIVSENTNRSFPIINYTEGTYYFIAVAYNNYGQTISNCITIVVEFPQGANNNAILGFSLYFLITFTCMISVFIARKLKNSLK